MTDRLGVIVNPRAGPQRKSSTSKDVVEVANATGLRVVCPASIEALESGLEKFRDQGVQVVAVAGGDGTISTVLTSILQLYPTGELPVVAILGGGTMNVLASNLGCRRPPAVALRRLVEQLSAGKTSKKISLRPLLVNGRAGFVFANIAAVRFLERFYAEGPSRRRALKHFGELALRHFTGVGSTHIEELFEPERLRVDAWFKGDQKVASAFNQSDFTAILAATVPRLPFRMHAFLGLTMGGDCARLVMLEPQSSRMALLKTGLSLIAPIRAFRRMLRECDFDRASIASHVALRYTVDGEILSAMDGQVRLALGPSIIFIGS